MKIQSIKFQNFRCFKELELELDSNISVIIGTNGAGKTAILDGITATLSGIKGGLNDRNKGLIDWLSPGDIRINQHGGISGTAKISTVIGNENLNFEIPRGTNRNIEEESIIGIDAPMLWREIGIQLKEKPDIHKQIPVFCSYGAHRTIDRLPDVILNNQPHSRLNAIEDFHRANETLGLVVNWLHDLHIEALLLNDQGEDASHLTKYRNTILKAVATALSAITDLNITPKKPRKLEFTWNGEKRLFSQLSQGYRSMITLVLDYARRLVIANPWMDNPLESEGVLIIDEIDSHLHPAWQQTVLRDLQKAFPNTQIICATHSPHILSSVEPKNIFVIGEDHQITQPTSKHTYGVESYRILADIFGVSSRPRIDEIEQKIEAVKKQIENGEHVDKALNDLEDYIGDDSPIIRNFRAQLIALSRK